ncbi:MAG: phosphoribosylglycinamide formyltransferase [Euryarchaeota archaeon]|nr:phosphoribosylglycinamide formyltransferase [Euryarchaeota archaeon]|tara:strand:- start:1998 stop:2696 length:699 start_codon:yes stop_codon:yes gene_type:complete
MSIREYTQGLTPYRMDMTLRIGTPTNPLRLAVMISGGGSGMKALFEHVENQDKSCHSTVIVLSDRLGIQGLSIASSFRILSAAVPLPKDIIDSNSRRIQHEELVESKLIENDVEAIILSGYMRILTPNFVSRWEGKILNIHPSLLPKFPGAHAHQEVLSSGETKSGCTVHFVDSGMDTGAIIEQSEVPVFPDDTLETLQERVKIEEHKLYPRIIDDFSEGKVRLIDGKIIRK